MSKLYNAPESDLLPPNIRVVEVFATTVAHSEKTVAPQRLAHKTPVRTDLTEASNPCDGLLKGPFE